MFHEVLRPVTEYISLTAPFGRTEQVAANQQLDAIHNSLSSRLVAREINGFELVEIERQCRTLRDHARVRRHNTERVVTPPGHKSPPSGSVILPFRAHRGYA